MAALTLSTAETRHSLLRARLHPSTLSCSGVMACFDSHDAAQGSLIKAELACMLCGLQASGEYAGRVYCQRQPATSTRQYPAGFVCGAIAVSERQRPKAAPEGPVPVGEEGAPTGAWLQPAGRTVIDSNDATGWRPAGPCPSPRQRGIRASTATITAFLGKVILMERPQGHV